MTPTHTNLGDQAIAIAELIYLKKKLPEYQVIEVPDINTVKGIKLIKKVIESDDIVMIHGGGNLGVLYPTAEKRRRLIVQMFEHNKIITFPQSAYFSDDKDSQAELIKSRSIYSDNKNFVLVARETLTKKFLEENFPKNKLLFTPDIVFFLNARLQLEEYKRSGILLALRKDKERSLSSNFIDNLVNRLKRDFHITYSDTVIHENIEINSMNRDTYFINKIHEFSKHQLVITDRLHGMLFSLLTKTPCIVFNNNNGKVKYTYYNWLKEVNYIKLMKTGDIDLILANINQLLKIKPISKKFDTDFYELTKYLKE
ncbi:polysaccharide pyruvyl transferase family protein [Latilactobacillus curvatus]|uniref:polysaccharide pyruvyl transferase family protein n=1 Tax=Latilactobacillus curvatus TaxID=28038 RepID=UPI0020740D5D|nr:polysaccharide pyruvyl transferase family protein [Latilactobacillus curvatus]MCM6844198.1 polysaccharide pyruvyl transferase family protein [Latilactobacillus curvatus]MCM6860915.1 polysaccharide pyruvyl transferase family protein [Latilactobacillus curvatus]MCM6868213.1 polysaccharide pyruvyl transferase family protein [Latilactobacillus curvatus]